MGQGWCIVNGYGDCVMMRKSARINDLAEETIHKVGKNDRLVCTRCTLKGMATWDKDAIISLTKLLVPGAFWYIHLQSNCVRLAWAEHSLSSRQMELRPGIRADGLLTRGAQPFFSGNG